jgi:alkylation response protein AidB-like acyl-CoA dehydrogenase
MANEEEQSRQVAEAAREREWKKQSFLRDLFLGSFRLDLVHPLSTSPVLGRPAYAAFHARLKALLHDLVDPVAIDESGEYPQEVLTALARLGAFGMKIPTEYGGLGFTQREYEHAMELVGSYDANVTALLSAHQSIGVPQPLRLFGTEAQKRKYLPLCARGAISGFALTEPSVGSDPARIASTAEPTADGSSYVLNGAKLWCTNGTLAKVLVVMARTPGDRISAFIVETDWEGVEVVGRCRFMGLKALANAELAFHDVVVPRENLIGEVGHGLRIALVTLNTGRLTLPAATSGAVKACLEICRKWASVRVQWGQPIGKHEAISHKLADMAASSFAMESISDVAATLADREGYDIRLEAAAAKEWNTVRAWQVVDEALEIRGGRGYETERSLAARGEVPIGIERMMRDSRINRIFEGSSEIMHLFMAREAVDKHLSVAGALIDPKKTPREKLGALLRAIAFYVVWYPSLWLRWSMWPRYTAFGPLARHVRYVDAASGRLARSVFYGMLVHRAGLERRQGFLFRLVDVAMELFAMTCVLVRAQQMRTSAAADGNEDATELAEVFCEASRGIVEARFHALWHNDDVRRRELGARVLAGDVAWLERGIMGLGRTAEELTPRTIRDRHPSGEQAVHFQPPAGGREPPGEGRAQR